MYQYLVYFGLLIVVKLLRGAVQLTKRIGYALGIEHHLEPADQFDVTSKDGQRKIRVNVHRNNTASQLNGDKPSAVYINWHGGGFVLKNQGEDHVFIHTLISSPLLSSTPLTVLDADYAHGPEDPFPAPIEDAIQVVMHVLSDPTHYDRNRIVIGGFSAGATIALGVCAHFGRQLEQGSLGTSNPIKGVVAFYPSIDMSSEKPERKNTDHNNTLKQTLPGVSSPQPSSEQEAPLDYVPDNLPTKYPGVVISPLLSSIFRRSLFRPPLNLTSKQDRRQWMYKSTRDPLINSLLADIKWFPKKIMLVTCQYDPSTPRAELWRRKLKEDGKGIVEVHGARVDGVAHGWDKIVSKEGDLGWKEMIHWNEQSAKFIADLIV